MTLRRLVALLPGCLLLLALGGWTDQWDDWPDPWKWNLHTSGNEVGTDVPDSSGVGPIWATLTSNGQQPTVYYGVDYLSLSTNEACYIEIVEGPSHTGNGMAMSHQHGDSTAGTPAAPHTSIVVVDSVAWAGDTLNVVVRTWEDDDSFIETVVASLLLAEQVDTTPPTIDVAPTVSLTYTGNGDTLTVSVTGGTYSETVTKSLVVTYASSYPSYGTEDAHWQYKTASVGVDSAVTASPVAVPSFIVPRAYHSDSLVVTIQAKDAAGNRSAASTIYNGLIAMPLGTTPTPDHDTYGVGAIEYGGDYPTSGSVAEWGKAEVLQLSVGMLLGTDDSDGQGYGDQWLARARTLGGKNVMAIEHTGTTCLDNDAQFFKQRKLRLFKSLYEAMVLALDEDSMVIAHDVDDTVCVPQNAPAWGADRCLLVNLLNATARDTFADFVVNEWNHSDNRLAYTGFYFDVWEYHTDFPVYSVTSSPTPNTAVFAADILDNDNDGTALRYDLNEQQALRTARAAFFDSVRASISETCHDSVNSYFLLGANSDISFVDTLSLSHLDMIQIEDFNCPPNAGNPYIVGSGVYYPYHNAADATWVRDWYHTYELLPPNSDLPDPATFSSELSNVISYMRSDAGGPYIMLEGGIFTSGTDNRMNEAYALLFDNVYSEWLNTPLLNVWARSYYHPDDDGYADLSGIGSAVAPAEIDSGGTMWTISREFSNGSVQVQLSNRANYDCDTDSMAYAVVVAGDTLRLSDDFDDAVDFTPPPNLTFIISTPDSIGDSLSYYWEIGGASLEDTLAVETEHQIKVIGWTGFESGTGASFQVDDDTIAGDVQTAFDLDDIAAGDSIMVRIRAADYPQLNFTAWDTTLAVFARLALGDVTAPTVQTHTASYDSTTQSGNLLTLFALTEANEDAYHRTAVRSGTDTTFGAWTDTVVAAGDTLYWMFEDDSTMAQIAGQEYSMIGWAKDAADNVATPDTANVTILRDPGGGGSGDVVTVYISNTSTLVPESATAASIEAAGDGDIVHINDMEWFAINPQDTTQEYTRTTNWNMDSVGSLPVTYESEGNNCVAVLFFDVANVVGAYDIDLAELHLWADSAESSDDSMVVLLWTDASQSDWTGQSEDNDGNWRYFNLSGTDAREEWAVSIGAYDYYSDFGRVGGKLIWNVTIDTEYSIDVTTETDAAWVTGSETELGYYLMIMGTSTSAIGQPGSSGSAALRPYLKLEVVK